MSIQHECPMLALHRLGSACTKPPTFQTGEFCESAASTEKPRVSLGIRFTRPRNMRCGSEPSWPSTNDEIACSIAIGVVNTTDDDVAMPLLTRPTN